MFPIRVQLSQDYLMVNDTKRRLAPGLAVTAEIKTGPAGALARPSCQRRRIIDFLLSPLAKRVEEAGRER